MVDHNGQRKYLTIDETHHFLAEAERRDPLIHSFCCMLVRSGCRISEALSLTADSIDFHAEHVTIETLKKRRKRVYRSVPLPRIFLGKIRVWLQTGALPTSGRLWTWSRMTAYRHVRDVMHSARIKGGHASPKGLRHGFGVRAIQSNVPPNLVQRWLGHADMKTTAIYTSAVGPEELAIAARMWKGTPNKSEHSRRSSQTAFGGTVQRYSRPTSTIRQTDHETDRRSDPGLFASSRLEADVVRPRRSLSNPAQL